MPQQPDALQPRAGAMLAEPVEMPVEDKNEDESEDESESESKAPLCLSLFMSKCRAGRRMATQWELIDASVAKRQVPLEKTYLGPIVQWDWQPPCDPMDYKRLDDYAFGKFQDWLRRLCVWSDDHREACISCEAHDWTDMPKAVFLRAVSVLNVFAIVPG